MVEGKSEATRVYFDGVFDLLHAGHMNALRQAKGCGDTLVAGVISDEEAKRAKSRPAWTLAERAAAVRAVKWVDEVLEGVPYDLSEDFLERLFSNHDIDFVVHGDDPCILPDGTDAYAKVKALGRYKEIRRTEGISTTDIIGRALAGKRSVPMNIALTSRRLSQFSTAREPTKGDTIVYVPGVFDAFNPSHLTLLEEARTFGSFLLVGAVDIASQKEGEEPPLLSIHERVLSLLACSMVDDVLIGGPIGADEGFVKEFSISVVAAPSDDAEQACSTGVCVRRLRGCEKKATQSMVIDRLAAMEEELISRFEKRKGQ